MLPVARFRSQPVGMVTTTPWLPVSTDPAPQWMWLASWSAATYQATPPLLFYRPAVWIPEHTHLIQWERPAVKVIPVLPPFYQASPLHRPHPLPRLADGWIPAEEASVFTRRDKPLPRTNQVAQRPVGPALRSHRLLFQSRLSGGARWDWTGPSTQKLKEAWPLILPRKQHKGAWLPQTISHGRTLNPPTQAVTRVRPTVFSSRFFSRFTLTDYRHKRQHVGGAKVSYGGALLLKAESHSQDADVSAHTEEEEEDEEDEEEEEEEEEGADGGGSRRPVASTPVPGSPWCVVWTGDDRVFFFNPTIHLSVWERPGELIGRDISRIIKDPPHKRKRKTPADRSSSCQSSSFHGDDEDEEGGPQPKRSRTEDSLCLLPRPGEVKLLPLELRMDHFRDMLLERGVSAFSSWEKELHKMVFDPRYLLLTSNQRKQVFEQFVKSRMKEEYKEKRSKLQKAREEFKQLLEESKVTSRWTFKEFCARHRADRRFGALSRKQEQEVLFSQHVASLRRRDRENRARLRKTT